LTQFAELLVDHTPTNEELSHLFSRAWGEKIEGDFGPILSRSLIHVCARSGTRLVGFVNVATDGGIHGFVLDTCVDPDFRRRGIASAMVRKATEGARERGAQWLHVDFEPHLEGFYRSLGFAPTAAGLIRLSP
jgi:ribosomal protein S18 acetylase RimI-like enzyme